MACLTDWLIDWLSDWLAGWLAGWLTDLLANWMTDELTADWLTDWRTDCRLTGWLTDGPTADWSTDRLTDRLLTEQLTDLPTDCRLTNWLTDGSTADWPTDWLTDWLTAHWLLTDCSLTTWPTNCQNISQKPPTRNAIGFYISMFNVCYLTCESEMFRVGWQRNYTAVFAAAMLLFQFLRIRYAANSVSLTCNTYVCVSPTKQTKVSHSLFIYAFSNLSLTTYLF